MSRGEVEFLVDAQLPPALARAITAAGYTAQHVADVGLLHEADTPIWNFACEHGCALVTKDEDFVAIRQRSKRGATVVWLRIRNSVAAVMRRAGGILVGGKPGESRGVRRRRRVRRGE